MHQVGREESGRGGDRMCASSPPGLRSLRRDGVDGFFAGAFGLAKQEMRRTWLSYPLSSLFVLFLGFFVVPSVTGVFELDGFGAGEGEWRSSTTRSSPTTSSW